jgi:hypothetical protein
MLHLIDRFNQLKQRRKIYLSFADDPQCFICNYMVNTSQSRDLKLMTYSSTDNIEEEVEEANRSSIHVFYFSSVACHMCCSLIVCVYMCMCEIKRKCTKNSTNLFEMLLLLLYFSSMLQRMCSTNRKHIYCQISKKENEAEIFRCLTCCCCCWPRISIVV